MTPPENDEEKREEGEESDDDDEEEEGGLTIHPAAAPSPSSVSFSHVRGLAWVTVDTGGRLSYMIRLDGLPTSANTHLQIDNGRRSRRLHRVISDGLAAPVQVSRTTHWSNGTLLMGAVDLEDLYNSDLYLNIAAGGNHRAIRGRIVQQGLGN